MSLNRLERRQPLTIPGALLLACLLSALLPPGAGGVPRGEYAHPQVLIQPKELKARIEAQDPNLRIIDFRHQAKYYLGHIPGAIQLWRSEIIDRRQTLPPAPHLENLLGRLGIDRHNTLVIYSDQCDHTHLWWLLAHYGFPLNQLRLLDGGLEAWKTQGYPTRLTSARLKPTTFRFPATPRQDYLLADLEEVKEAMRSPGQSIVDVRPLRLYLGEGSKEGAARPGRIPGAVWICWEDNRVAAGPDQGCWKSAAALQQMYASRGINPDKDIFIYGHAEREAAFTLVSLYLAGYPLEKLHVYGGGWIEWSRSKEPVETGPVK